MTQRDKVESISEAVVISRKIINKEKKLRAESVARENKYVGKIAHAAGTTSSYINRLIKGGR